MSVTCKPANFRGTPQDVGALLSLSGTDSIMSEFLAENTLALTLFSCIVSLIAFGALTAATIGLVDTAIRRRRVALVLCVIHPLCVMVMAALGTFWNTQLLYVDDKEVTQKIVRHEVEKFANDLLKTMDERNAKLKAEVRQLLDEKLAAHLRDYHRRVPGSGAIGSVGSAE